MIYYTENQIDDLRAVIDNKYAEISSLRAEIARLREALAPFAAIADHFPLVQIHGGRPYTGTIYAWHSSDIPDAEMTVEHVHAARAALAQVAEVGE